MPKSKNEKGKDNKRRRKLKRIKGNGESLSTTRTVEDMFSSSTSTSTNPKNKNKRKRIKKKTLSKLMDVRSGFSNPGGAFKEGKNKLFTVRRADELSKSKGVRKDPSERRRKKRHSKGTNKPDHEKRFSENKENKMAAESSEAKKERGRKHSENKERTRKKPRSLPPLPRTPKSPLTRTPQSSAEAENVRRFIGSPPPPALANLEHYEDMQTIKSCWRSNEDLPEEDTPEYTVYAPIRSFSQSQPKITLNRAPKSKENEALYETTVIKTTPSSRKSTANSMSSLIKSTSSLNLNSSLMLPPKLLTYVAEDGSPAVQEFVPDDRSQSAVSRRSSTPSIRDLPSPLTGVSPLEVHPKHRSLHSRNSKVQLSPLPKH